MSEQNAKDRVYAAADKIVVDKNPTVASVREEASVSNGDATRYLKQWREERATSGATIAALPQPLAEIALRLAGGMWAEASTAAAAQHVLLEASWRNEQARQEMDINELAATLDAVNKASADAEVRHTGEREVLLAELAGAGVVATDARTEAAGAHAELAAAQAAHVEMSNSLAIQFANTLDVANQASADAETRHATEIRTAREELADQRADAANSRAELAAAMAAHVEASNALATELAEARATITSLQVTQTALMARIPGIPN